MENEATLQRRLTESALMLPRVNILELWVRREVERQHS